MESRSDKEKKQLFLNYLNTHIFKYWRDEGTIENACKYGHSLELIITSACNTKCTYCYYKNFGEELNPVALCSKKNIMDNLHKICMWIKKEGFSFSSGERKDHIEIFSGEFFKIPFYKEILEELNTYLPKGTIIVVPTNGTFALSEEKTAEVERILLKYNSKKDSNIDVLLSLSIDGKYSDNRTRQLRNVKEQYTDEFYDRLFTFAAKTNCCFHPMVCAENVGTWCESFDWFIENIMKYFKVSRRTAYDYMYLLEVRNPNWTVENNKDFEKFIHYVVNDTFKAFDSDPELYADQFITKKALNMFSSIFGFIGRGLGCSIQQTFAVRLSDLTLVPCHRTAYDGYNAGKLKIDEEGNFDFEVENPYLYMMVNAFNASQGPLCNTCEISQCCSHPCLGCNYEVNKDFFIPVSTVCEMEKSKVRSLVEAYVDVGAFYYVIEKITQNRPLEYLSLRGRLKVNQLVAIAEKYEEGKKNE